MNLRRVIYVVGSVILVGYLCGSASGENPKTDKASVFTRIPSLLQPYVNALGKRTKEKGKEKTIFVGQYFESGAASNTQVVIQLPRMARLEGFKGRNSIIAFDGERKKNAMDRKDGALLDTFLVDTVEGMFASIQELNSVRPIGLDFRPDPRKYPNYSGPSYDVYDVKNKCAFLEEMPFQSRQYYFDSKTQLLQRTIYTDTSVSPPANVETRFMMWGKIDGSAYPAGFERYENGKRVFSFIATNIESGPADDIANYR
jgi:hypothetical protein